MHLVSRRRCLGEEFGRRIQALAGQHEIVSYGKAYLVGSQGEYGTWQTRPSTNPAADPVRVALGGGESRWVPSTGKRAAAGFRH